MPDRLSLVFAVFFLFPLVSAFAGEQRVPGIVEPSIDYLSNLVPLKPEGSFEVDKIVPLIEFVAAEKNAEMLHAGQRDGANSAYYEFDIESSLYKILHYAFNPDIPTQVFRPSSLRSSYWTNNKGLMPALWEKLDLLENPLVFSGVEREVITPDTNTGAYYQYDQDKTLLLFKYKGKNAFAVLSRQKGESGVGRKGVVIGPDKDWNYFYSGKKGLTKKGLGWVKSRMYNSFSISLFYEKGEINGKVRCATFSWMSAGWSGINMVKTKHILKGIKRYASDFEFIMESPSLPSAEDLAAKLSELKALSHEERRMRLAPMLSFFLKESDRGKSLARPAFAKLVKKGEYFARMSDEQVESALFTEEMKCILDKGCRTPVIRPASPPLARGKTTIKNLQN
ncbi:MAG: hypothetical protein IMF07_07230 [Proteobacteria bacterium]|nr:hypothetical protein [Pseudomonadota bacterium]